MKKPDEFYDMFNNDDIMMEACKESLDPRDVLYHYTTADGLKKIIESGSMYASHYKYMNDTSEITYSLKMINKLFEETILTIKNKVQDKISGLFRMIFNSKRYRFSFR